MSQHSQQNDNIRDVNYFSDDTSSSVPVPRPLAELRQSLHDILGMMDNQLEKPRNSDSTLSIILEVPDNPSSDHMLQTDDCHHTVSKENFRPMDDNTFEQNTPTSSCNLICNNLQDQQYESEKSSSDELIYRNPLYNISSRVVTDGKNRKTIMHYEYVENVKTNEEIPICSEDICNTPATKQGHPDIFDVATCEVVEGLKNKQKKENPAPVHKRKITVDSHAVNTDNVPLLHDHILNISHEQTKPKIANELNNKKKCPCLSETSKQSCIFSKQPQLYHSTSYRQLPSACAPQKWNTNPIPRYTTMPEDYKDKKDKMIPTTLSKRNLRSHLSKIFNSITKRPSSKKIQCQEGTSMPKRLVFDLVSEKMSYPDCDYPHQFHCEATSYMHNNHNIDAPLNHNQSLYSFPSQCMPTVHRNHSNFPQQQCTSNSKTWQSQCRNAHNPEVSTFSHPHRKTMSQVLNRESILYKPEEYYVSQKCHPQCSLVPNNSQYGHSMKNYPSTVSYPNPNDQIIQTHIAATQYRYIGYEPQNEETQYYPQEEEYYILDHEESEPLYPQNPQESCECHTVEQEYVEDHKESTNRNVTQCDREGNESDDTCTKKSRHACKKKHLCSKKAWFPLSCKTVINTPLLCQPRDKVEVYYFDHGNSGYYRTTDSRPSVFTENFIQQTDYFITKFWGEVFGSIHLGVAFVISFILQAYRFLLYSLVRPLTVGVIQLTSDYLIKPLLTIIFNGIIQPVLILLFNIATSVRDLCEPIANAIGFFYREIAVLVRAFRFIEANDITYVTPRQIGRKSHSTKSSETAYMKESGEIKHSQKESCEKTRGEENFGNNEEIECLCETSQVQIDPY